MLNTIRDSIDYASAEVLCIESIRFKDNDDCGGFHIPANIVSAAASINATIDVPIERYHD